VRIFWLFVFSCALSAASYTTYLGDPSATYSVAALATDSAGNTYATGTRYFGSSTDLFVSKIDPSGNVALLASFGKVPPSVAQPVNLARAIAVDSNGNIFVVGETPLTNFPLVHPLQSAPGAYSNLTGFLVKFAPDGSILLSTYLGGTEGASEMSGVAVDSQGDVYVTGTTWASDYPHTPGLPNDPVVNNGPSAAWFAKIAADGSSIIYAGGIVPSISDCLPFNTCSINGAGGTAVAVDPAGNAYIAANTNLGGISGTPGALLTTGIGAFILKIGSAGDGIAYLTFLGSAEIRAGPSYDPGNLVHAIAVDSAGDAYIAGETNDPNFPATPGSFQTTLPGAGSSPAPESGFIAELNPAGSAMVWATFLGGSSVNTVAVDANGHAWVSGGTSSADFPISTGWSSGDEFLAEFNSSGSALVYGERFPNGMVAGALAFDSGGALHTAGYAELVSSFSPPSSAFESAAPQIFGVTNATGAGSLSGRVSAAEVFSIYGLNLGPATGVSSQLNSQGLVPTTVAGVEVLIDGVAAPLLYVSATQINAVAPVELSLDSIVDMNLTVNGTALPAFRMAVDSQPPEVFPAAMNQDGTVNSAANPAKAGSFVTVWADNAGTFSTVDGQVASGAQTTYCACTILDQPLVSGALLPPDSQVNVSYAGAAPGLVNGITQINFQIPPYSGAPFEQAFYLEVGASVSNAFYVYISQ